MYLLGLPERVRGEGWDHGAAEDFDTWLRLAGERVEHRRAVGIRGQDCDR